MAKISHKAEVRRQALRKALAAANLTPSEASRLAGLPSANALFNFLNNRSQSLSQDTIERLARAIPGATIASLTGNEVAMPSVAEMQGVVVRAIAEGGRWREAFDLRRQEQYEALLPVSAAHQSCGAFGVEVHSPGFERVFPDGTILVCIPFPQFKGELRSGRRLIVQHVIGKRLEITVRELEIDALNRAWLWPRSDHPEHQAPIAMPWPFTGELWKHDISRFSVTAVIVGAYIPQ